MNFTAASGLFVRTFHAFSFLFLVLMSAFVVGYTVMCAFDLAPWLSASVAFGDIQVENAGMYIQLAVTMFFFSMMFFAPANGRIMALEKSHRNFRINMDDVARAYHRCHAADREGVFTLSSEFDAVRERIQFMRDHPDLSDLESDILTVAAQMSERSRGLADIYSDEKVAHARTFLRQRQEEVERQQRQIIEALHTCQEIEKWAQQLDTEESVIANQLARLDDKLQAVLPTLGYGFEQEEVEEPETNVVPITAKPAAE